MSPKLLSATLADPGMAVDPAALRAAATYAPVLCMVEYRITEPERSRVTGYCGVQLGSVDVFRYEGVGVHCGDRATHHIRADRLDDYLVTIPLRARIEFRTAKQSGYVDPGGFALLSTASPFFASISNLERGEVFSALHMRVAGSLLRQRMPQAPECCAVPIALRPGAGMILRRICEMSVSEGRHLSANEGGRLASMLVEAVSGAVADAPEILALPALSSNWAHMRIARQARAYIEAHLTDPGLDTGAVAAHCRVSKRYLQAVFAGCGETVGATIRELRLQRCREALRNPALRKQSVARIAMNWGFLDLPHFCRAYKARFDASPGRDRALHCPGRSESADLSYEGALQ